jgi:hypothetical protein
MDKDEETNHGQMLAQSPSSHTEAESIEIDHVGEKKLVRKLDVYILPFVMLLYLFSFLDRQVTKCTAKLEGSS